MKFIVSSSVLLKQLQAVGGVLSTNNTLPILDNFLFELKGNELSITASDLETTMKTRINLEMSEEDGSVAIPAKILLDTLKTFSDVPVSFTVDLSSYNVLMTVGEGKYRFVGQSGEEYPRAVPIEEPSKISINSKVLANAISKTITAATNDELRPAMSGIYCELNTDNVTFVATDAHKLVRYRRTDIKAEEEASFILPQKPLNQLKNILIDDEEAVDIEYNQKNARFVYKNIIMTCRLIEGKYPNYTSVIPDVNPNKMIVDRVPFTNAIRRVSLFSSQSTYQIIFKIAGSELILSAEDIDYSNEATERLSCNYEGSDLEIAFNSKFMLDMLNNVNSEQIRIEMSEPNKAGLIIPMDNDDEGEDILMLVMPVMLNN